MLKKFVSDPSGQKQMIKLEIQLALRYAASAADYSAGQSPVHTSASTTFT